ncbi:PREDICTED: pleckstrin homology domain-containing family M member 1 [Habropoda laboriosa]|uniref:pleckstrin homology domain-containing family M member 1 n=1 Tax=Habropoda laboriosa TaxID=597456 RepID=UPI00083E1B05|nr:PREDICTED: pleckstrin homology domain-containing family M member 1 [Habropoda laboriosa]
MNSFLKTVNSMTSNRNVIVREALQTQLNMCVAEIQYAQGMEENNTIKNCDKSMNLCSILEAIFLHGLKDSLLNRVTEALSGPDFDAVPQPSFWGPLLVFSHRQIIDQIQGLSQLTTEVGYCRAWIRLALNEGLLASYFYSIRRDNSALKPYYNQSAFIRDVDLVEVARRLIENLDNIHFEFACNSSLLNFWSNTPLLLAGIWSPPMKSCPVFSAVDIAKTITTELTEEENFCEQQQQVETASSIGSFSSFNSSQSALNNGAYIAEDDALKIILANKKSSNIDVDHLTNDSTNNVPLKEEEKQNIQEEEEKEKEEKDGVENKFSSNDSPKNDIEINTILDVENLPIENIVQNHDTLHDITSTAVGNSLIGKLGWSTSFEDCKSSLTSPVTSHDSGTDAPRTPCDGPTYDSLIQSYQSAGNTSVTDLQEFLKRYPKKQLSIDGTEVQSENKAEINFDEQLEKLPREKGLDVQNYSCFECDHAIGMTFSKIYTCSYTGNYYCSKCMSQNEYIIPSRVIYNWDLKHYPVCNKAATYLQNCSVLLDFKILNPQIYMAVDTMAQLQSLRIQLNLLRAYLFTCREPIIESLQKKVTPRDYLYEHVHQYSIFDLHDIANGTLAQQLQKVVKFARNHVINCWLCSQKGFICEICNNPKVIYPFDMDSTYRCGSCNAVFHSECSNANKPCPRCKRKRERMDLPLLDVGCTDLSLDDAPFLVDTN